MNNENENEMMSDASRGDNHYHQNMTLTSTSWENLARYDFHNHSRRQKESKISMKVKNVV